MRFSQNYPFARRTLFRLARKRLRIFDAEMLPKNGPFILVGNHQSYLDPPMVGFAVIPQVKKKIGFLTKTSVARSFGIFANYLGMIGINPEDKAESLQRAMKLISDGILVCIFPEGKRNYDPATLTKGKTGAARLALHTGVPVIPLGIRVPQGQTTGQSVRQFFFSRIPLEIHFGQPLHFAAMPDAMVTKELLEDTTRTMMQAVASLSQKSYPF